MVLVSQTFKATVHQCHSHEQDRKFKTIFHTVLLTNTPLIWGVPAIIIGCCKNSVILSEAARWLTLASLLPCQRYH